MTTLRAFAFDTCTAESMVSMPFPPPEGGGTATVGDPLALSPGDDDEGDAGAGGETRREDGGAKRRGPA